MAIIEIKDVSKVYKLYNKHSDRVKEIFSIGSTKRRHEDFYALKNISFSIEKGETFGIIGVNGSGKSTLLKILTGVLHPTEGEAIVNGKVSAILELGAGFNADYSGIENIYLSGALMGMSREHINEKMPEIVEFAEIGEFIHQPVKTYSSGMFVRLAYSIQACLNPEILIVDEALAVGDAAFSLKCMNHMKRLVENGTTVIFVTHDVQVIKTFCSRVAWLKNGSLVEIGDPSVVTSHYVRSLFEKTDSLCMEKRKAVEFDEVEREKFEGSIRWGNQQFKIIMAKCYGQDGQEKYCFNYGEEIIVKLTGEVVEELGSVPLGLGFGIRDRNGLDIITCTTIEDYGTLRDLKPGSVVASEFSFQNILAPGNYSLVVNSESRELENPVYYDFIENAKVLKVISDRPVFSIVRPLINSNVKVL